MKISFRKIALFFLAVYCIVSFYAAYNLIKKVYLKKQSGKNSEFSRNELEDDSKWNPWGLDFDEDVKDNMIMAPHKDFNALHRPMYNEEEEENGVTSNRVVEVWGKAAIGHYLWEHILEGRLEKKMNGVWSYGAKQIDNIHFRFRTGPGVVPTKAPQDVHNLILVLNGREQAKVEYAQMWLNYLPQLRQLVNVGVVLLGNEECRNDWLEPYLEKNGGIVKMVFVVYDSSEIDDQYYFQWPLGVATYRNFPKIPDTSLRLNEYRPFMCNFLGTVYPDSSRQELLHIIKLHQITRICFIKPRMEWLSSETEASQEEYLKALYNSELTLSPVGKNSECYRIWEALACGSTPVIEDVMTTGRCGPSPMYRVAPYRLLKEYNAPVIWLKNWSELPNILESEKKLSEEDKIKRRKGVIEWYKKFKRKMRDRFIDALNRRFFNPFDV